MGSLHPITLQPSVRALVLDGDRLIVFRRTPPGRPVYWSVPGGHVEPADATFEHALHREMLEELGAVVRSVTPLTTLRCLRPEGVKPQHVYGCRLVSLDAALRCGPEFDDPARGHYETVRLPLEPAAVEGLDLVPPELAAYLVEHIARLPELIGP
ncbi:ADP-ribose pyrophosphatase YjhB, NUDIX family [Sinosporangium album]|uniref:ADP-ribose pyrophosphatase YjhB, NUDIX family n=1 Tax=Sinosporangium album TaxID=504805 RepID=A0A1G8E0I2_9ACTN|nr:NUDIX hydrolase [Sinosporangium album]SDH63341.1 ADP-ribose pyrophosphatase YjhB, NUDIX family [Sinosporangium album]